MSYTQNYLNVKLNAIFGTICQNYSDSICLILAKSPIIIRWILKYSIYVTDVRIWVRDIPSGSWADPRFLTGAVLSRNCQMIRQKCIKWSKCGLFKRPGSIKSYGKSYTFFTSYDKYNFIRTRLCFFFEWSKIQIAAQKFSSRSRAFLYFLNIFRKTSWNQIKLSPTHQPPYPTHPYPAPTTDLTGCTTTAQSFLDFIRFWESFAKSYVDSP